MGSSSFSPLADGRPLYKYASSWVGTSRRVRAGSGSSSERIAEGPGLAHDAGNLLGALRLYCDLLARPGVLREEHRHYAEELQLLSRRSGALIDRLLNPATTERRSLFRQEAAAAAEGAIVPEVIEQCRGLLNMIARRAVEVVYGAEASMPVPVSSETVERILVNLTKNAAEASPTGGAILLQVSRVREETIRDRSHRPTVATRIVLSVQDQGCGMSAAAAKVLLDGRSPQAVNPSTSPGGHGLGLRVVRELVAESGGELQLKSQSGCGTTVEIAWAVKEAEYGGSAVWHGTTGQGSNGHQGGVSC